MIRQLLIGTLVDRQRLLIQILAPGNQLGRYAQTQLAVDASSVELTVTNSDAVEESKGDDDETKGGETKTEAPSAALLMHAV